ncbi:sugar phosphate isomerase/epimerase family protein [Haladaptatus sp. DFWS20]|uniref:sugar phosphate isomerase/epimerase family protein n=1 Tax=Haladaptatus sp. DFWS20 TaxID=3403467 RepID=UPI003EBD3EE3
MQTSLLTKVFNGCNLETACKLTAEAGYDAVELMGREPHLGPETSIEEAEGLREYLDELELEVSCLASYTGNYANREKSEADREAELTALDHYCDLAVALDCDLIRHNPGGPAEHHATTADYERAASWLQRAADRAAEDDLRLGVEIHSSTIVESSTTAVDLFERIERDNICAIHDAGNMYISDVPYGPTSVATLGEWLGHVHVKDEVRISDPDAYGAFEIETTNGEETFRPCLLGTGGADHGPLFTALQEQEYDGALTAECHLPPHATLDPLAIATHERATVEDLWIADNE